MLKHHKTWRCWYDMIRRCKDQRLSNYHRYGGRGITVCKRWLASYDNFLEDMGEAPSFKSIERINNDGNYEPANCKWATHKEQMQNTSIPKSKKQKKIMKYKKFPITEELDEMLKKEVKASALTGNSICILALTEYLKKKEKERSK